MTVRSRAGTAARERTLTGWGRLAPTTARVVTPASADEVAGLVRDAAAGLVRDAAAGLVRDAAAGRGVIARGLGRSYNNAAQNQNGLVILTDQLTRISSFDPATGVLTCEAGVSLEQLMIVGLPAGWFVPVSPGTRRVTVGGAIAADVHGKNHHVAGSFARHVLWFDLLLADGQEQRVTPGSAADLFWLTAGGMGLTGIILRAAIQLTRVQTSRVRVDTVRTVSLDETMAVLADADDRSGYTVAWLDCLATGGQLGRAVVTSGDFAAVSELPRLQRRHPLAFRPGARFGVPDVFPAGLLNQYTIALANAAYYRKAPRRRVGEIQPIGAFFHPLDAIRNWNRVYGPAGFRQYQFVVPSGQEYILQTALERISRARAPSFVTVLKRFGDADPGYLSFPLRGWTLALDFPARTPGLAGLLAWLDEQVAHAGGRVYLAKDSTVSPDMLAAMYPRLDDFRKRRAELDPAGLLASDLSRRLGL